MDNIVLFCFPYAGGSAIVYNNWKKHVSPHIHLKPVELKGRGHRMSERMYRSPEEMIDDIFYLIKDTIPESDYAFFGHSLGAIAAYEVAQKVRQMHLRPPRHIFFSGRGAPHIIRADEKKYHLMDEDEFEKEVLQLGGTPPEFFRTPELLELFLPVLKNDFRIAETPLKKETIFPFETDITVFLGKEDDLTPEQCDGWKIHSKEACRIIYLNGGHFFLHEQMMKIIDIINSQLTRP